jgi:hypothetical protein
MYYYSTTTWCTPYGHFLCSFLRFAVDWNAIRKTVGHSSKLGKGATTLFAGYVALAVLDGLLLLILGNQHDTRR